ncbi:MAG TPA: hypothetical protein VJS43_07525 [Candidatus Acidoferrales bacterium]|nr:hypothetical protein [Candidatus Acidoferrales bacterium]
MTGIAIAFSFLALLGIGIYAQIATAGRSHRLHRKRRRVNHHRRAIVRLPASVASRRAHSQPRLLQFQFDDGGRKAAGYKGKTGDCVVRSITIATGLPYQQVYDKVNELAKRERTGSRKRGKSNARTGVYKGTTHKLLESLGWRWTATMEIGSGCKVHLRADELPTGRLIVSVSGHLTAVIDGVIHDTHDPSRRGTRCVYGYWQRGNA